MWHAKVIDQVDGNLDSGCLGPQACKGLVGGDRHSPLCVPLSRRLPWAPSGPWVFWRWGREFWDTGESIWGDGAESMQRIGIDAALTRPGCSFSIICVFGAGGGLDVLMGRWEDGCGTGCSLVPWSNLGQKSPRTITNPRNVPDPGQG